MYNTSYFKEDDKQVLFQFLVDHPFALLTGTDDSGNHVATHVPMLAEEREGKWFLKGHIMRNTDHHKAFEANNRVLAVFSGPHTYVSASWYTNQQSGSTWNYMSVHLHGKLSFMSTEDMISMMRELTLKFEKENTKSPTIYDNLPDEYTARMIPGIVGFEIEVERAENVFKLSQNKDERSYQNIILQLKKQGGNSTQIAEEMARRFRRVFPI